MKNVLLLILFMILSIGNMAMAQNAGKEKLSRSQKKEIKKQKMLSQISDAIAKDSIVIHIDKIRPSFAYNIDKASYLGYTGQVLKLENGRLSINFLYIGEMPTAIVGDLKMTVYTKEQEVKPVKDKNLQTGNTHYYFTFTNESEDNDVQLWECFIEIQPNGESHITIQSKGYNPMIYQGYMETKKRK